MQQKLDQKDAKLESKEAELRKVMQDNVKSESELKKQLALVEQKCDILQRKVSEESARGEESREWNKSKAQELREFADVIKELRRENKSLRAQLQSVGAKCANEAVSDPPKATPEKPTKSASSAKKAARPSAPSDAENDELRN